jgi:hypothetical protein
MNRADTQRLNEGLAVIEGTMIVRGRTRKPTRCERCKLEIPKGEHAWRCVHESHAMPRMARVCEPCVDRVLGKR